MKCKKLMLNHGMSMHVWDEQSKHLELEHCCGVDTLN